MTSARGGRKTLDRALSRAGACSRSQAREAIAAGRVSVNGRTVRDPDAWVDPLRDRVALAGAPLRARPRAVVMLHKPTGYVTTRSDERGRPTVYALLRDHAGDHADADTWLAPVGRLDRDTSGLLLFTNDTDLAAAITAPGSGVAKEYEVLCEPALGDDALARLRRGVVLADGPALPAKVRRLGSGADASRLSLAIVEGRNRQVRRMVEAAGATVLALHRTAIGPLRLDLPLGASRPLTAREIAALEAAADVTSPRRRRTRPDRAR